MRYHGENDDDPSVYQCFWVLKTRFTREILRSDDVYLRKAADPPSPKTYQEKEKINPYGWLIFAE